jgi:hypothetical protein
MAPTRDALLLLAITRLERQHSTVEERLRAADGLRALLSAHQAQAEPQVMGRVHNNEGQGKAALNSIGRSLPDNAPLYAAPPSSDQTWNAAIAEAANVCQLMHCRPEFEPEFHDKQLAIAEKSILSLARPSQAQEPIKAECQCDIRTRLVGDGCAICNPELAAEMSEPVTGAVDETEYEGNLKFPDGYCTDPNGVVCAPRGKKGDFDFGYDLGYADGLSVRRNALTSFPHAQQAPARSEEPK